MAALWQMMQFWKKPKKNEYRLVTDENSEVTLIEITSGIYAGVIYSYGMVKLKPESAIPVLQFNYTIVNPGQHTEELLQNDENFVIMLGDILTEIIIENEPIRTDNPEEPDLQ